MFPWMIRNRDAGGTPGIVVWIQAMSFVLFAARLGMVKPCDVVSENKGYLITFVCVRGKQRFWRTQAVGVYQTDYWQSSGWGMNRRETQSGTYHPFLPDKLAGRDIRLMPEAASAIARAQTAVALLNQEARCLTDTEPLARLLLRSEALASSRIEGLQMNAGRLLEFEALDELGVSHRLDAAEAAIMANITAMDDAIASVAEGADISLDIIRTVNATLLKGSHLEGEGGTLRTVQNWIGGNNVNPVGAAYVPPRPEYVGDLMEDLVLFCNESQLPGLAVAAIAHAQLETIHPFADGNGRTGRTLVHMLLRRAGLIPNSVPPVSLVLATDKARYINNLAAFRCDDSQYESNSECDAAWQTCVSDWVEYFANAMLLACERAQGFERRMEDMQAEWRIRGSIRANSCADVLVDVLPSNPVVSVASAARLTRRSAQAARLALKQLEGMGILVQNAKNRKSNIYVAQEVLDAFTAYERALATPGGDTSSAKPSRPVPLRVPRERRS